MKFVVLDVETANPDLSSICQIGIACFRDGRLESSWSLLSTPKMSSILFMSLFTASTKRRLRILQTGPRSTQR